MKKSLVFSACLALATLGLNPVLAKRSDPPSSDIVARQVILDRLGFSPGVIDGRAGASLTKAVKGFQEARGLEQTGQIDAATGKALAEAAGGTPGIITVKLTQADLAGPFVGPIPKDSAAQAKLPAMGYSNALEALAERYHTTSATLIALNSADTRLAPGVAIRAPNTVPPARDYPDTLKPEWRQTLASLNVGSDQPKAAKLVVDKSDGVLRVYDDADKLVAQFPATMGSSHDPLPIGNWKVQGASYNPSFHFNPALFWDAKSTDTKQLLKPGPNGPVGVVWLDLDKPHYGIHGTASPETIGRAESHGCVRLTNWDAARLSLMVKPGTPAVFQE